MKKRSSLNVLGRVFALNLVFFALISISAFAFKDYNETGNLNGEFNLGTGFFNEQLTEYNTALRLITTPRQTPLISDLNEDGTNEIIVLDGSTFKIFQSKDLTSITAFSLSTSEVESPFSNFITYDIDDDNKTEIIIANNIEHSVYILQFNDSTHFGIDANISFNNPLISHSCSIQGHCGETLIKCGKINECVLIVSNEIGPNGENPILSAVPFNSTDLGNVTNITGTVSIDSVYCFPRINDIQYKDYNNDGTIDYIFNAIRFRNSAGNSQAQIMYLNVNSTFGIKKISSKEINGFANSISGYNNRCYSEFTVGSLTGIIQNYFTSPLVFDSDNSLGTGLETIIGISSDMDDFNIKVYDKNGNEINSHPIAVGGNGVMLSNPMRYNKVFASDSEDYCILGANIPNGKLDLLCGSNTDSISGLDSIDFFYEYNSSQYNIQTSHYNYNVISHTTEQKSSNSQSELINSYGVFELDYLHPISTCYLTPLINNCELDRIWENPKTNAVVLSVDVEKVGRDDLIILQNNTLWYIDDKFSNSKPAEFCSQTSGAFCTAYTINPCIDGTWKQNSSVEIRITPKDIDNDLVSARAVLYYGDANVQDVGFSSNVSTGTTIPFSYKANTTTALGVLLMQVRDNFDTSKVTEKQFSFSVSSNGFVFNDCITDSGTGAVSQQNQTLNATVTDINENVITSNLRTLSNTTKLGEGLLYLIIMGIIAIMLFKIGESTHTPPKMTTGIIFIVEMILFIVGAKLQLISIGIIITIVTVSIAIIVLMLRGLGTKS